MARKFICICAGRTRFDSPRALQAGAHSDHSTLKDQSSRVDFGSLQFSRPPDRTSTRPSVGQPDSEGVRGCRNLSRVHERVGSERELEAERSRTGAEAIPRSDPHGQCR